MISHRARGLSVLDSFWSYFEKWTSENEFISPSLSDLLSGIVRSMFHSPDNLVKEELTFKSWNMEIQLCSVVFRGLFSSDASCSPQWVTHSSPFHTGPAPTSTHPPLGFVFTVKGNNQQSLRGRINLRQPQVFIQTRSAVMETRG